MLEIKSWDTEKAVTCHIKLEERNEKGKNRESGIEWIEEKQEQWSSYSNINTSPRPRDPDCSAHYITHSDPAHSRFWNAIGFYLCSATVPSDKLLMLLAVVCYVLSPTDICVKETMSLADSLYNLQLIQEFCRENLNNCCHFTLEDMLYAPNSIKVKHDVSTFKKSIIRFLQSTEGSF